MGANEDLAPGGRRPGAKSISVVVPADTAAQDDTDAQRSARHGLGNAGGLEPVSASAASALWRWSQT